MLVGFKKLLVGFKNLGKYDGKSIIIFGKSWTFGKKYERKSIIYFILVKLKNLGERLT